METETPGTPNFEVFKKKSAPIAKEPYVTIQKKGTISMNRPAYVAIGSPEAVELLYDRAETIVGIRAVDPSVEHAYPVRSPGKKNSGSVVIAGTAFTKYFEIPTEASIRRSARADNGVLMVDLKEQGTEVTSNRRRRTSVDEKRSPDSDPV